MKLYLILLSLLYSVCASSQRFVLQNKDYSLSIEKDTIFHPFQFKYDPITGLKRKVIRSGGLQNKNIFVVDSIYNGYNKLSSVRTFVNTNVYIEKSFDKNVDYIDAIKVVVIDKEFCFRILYNSDIEITEINATILDFDNYMEVKEYLYESNLKNAKKPGDLSFNFKDIGFFNITFNEKNNMINSIVFVEDINETILNFGFILSFYKNELSLKSKGDIFTTQNNTFYFYSGLVYEYYSNSNIKSKKKFILTEDLKVCKDGEWLYYSKRGKLIRVEKYNCEAIPENVELKKIPR